jgi:CRISPR-associated protein Csb1
MENKKDMSSVAKQLNLADVVDALNGSGIAFRRRTRLQPAGGPGDKIFPPTYEGGRYCEETRRIEGEDVPCVLVDSVASQANRMELALKQAFYAGKTSASLLPFIVVDFAAAGLPEVGEITSLEAPHRIADAILRDSKLGAHSFEESEPGQAFVHSTAQKAAGLMRYCPTALVFGMWHSTGIMGGLGTKVQRSLVSEVVAVNACLGKKVASRIDPLQIETGPVLYETPDRKLWTMDPTKARQEKGKPVLKGKEGKPSEANHGNIPPQISDGGVTCDYILQNTVLSLAALRRIAVDGNQNAEKETTARAALSALALCGATLLNLSEGYDLRSRCMLAPEAPAPWELVNADGTIVEFSLNAAGARKLLEEAVAALAKAGIAWESKPVVLTPNENLAELVRKNRDLQKQKLGEE